MYENYTWKFWVTAVLAALAIWGINAGNLSLGLDLQGGAQLIYRLEVRERGWIGADVRQPGPSDKDKQGLIVVSVAPDSPASLAGLHVGDIIKKVGEVPQASDAAFAQLIERSHGETLELTYYSKRAEKEETKKVSVESRKASESRLAENVIEVLKKRLDSLGLKEMEIARQGRLGIIISVPGGSKEEIEEVEDIVSRGGKLDFRIVANSETNVNDTQRRAEIQRIFTEKRNGTYFPDDKFDIALIADEDGKTPNVDEMSPDQAVAFYTLLKNPGVSGEHLKDANRTLSAQGTPAIGFSWNAYGARMFRKMTGQNVNKLMAVTLDGVVVQQANIEEAIGESGIIRGRFSDEDIRKTVVVLKGGALQAKPVLQSKELVGPSIGRVSLTIGQYSIVGATILVLAFMLTFYRGSGVIANIALVLNLVLILGILTIFEATLTLPGIAGILLTAGMAVDANILIFERVREEIEKEASLKQAIQAGYDRAFSTIFDANLTTFITAIILFYVGTGPIKGFAVTLMVGILCSMFTALFVTKLVYGFMISNELLTEMKMARLLDKTNIDFMAIRGKWGMISLICINLGFFVFVVRGADKYGIDFTGGSVVQMNLAEPMTTLEVEAILKGDDKLEGAQVVMTGQNTGTKGYQFQVKTRSVAEELKKEAGEGELTEQDLFRQIVEKLFAGKLVESSLLREGQRWSTSTAADGAAGKVTLTFDLLAVRPTGFDDHPEPTAELLEGLLRKRGGALQIAGAEGLTVKAGSSPEGSPYKAFEITTGAVQMGTSAEEAQYNRLLGVLEKSDDVVVATNFPRVSSIGASIAYNLKSKAIISMFFSLIAIVLYITIRFEFRFGVAAIAALIHDVLFTLGFMAILDALFSAAGIAFDAKINLPTVAAFLTIIGYSLNDTIVVFDRIRENMGNRKLKGKDEEEVVNISINQTLTRTILTSVTTFFVVFVLFVASFFGLSSIQGLSVALLCGIIVGTYSSIFVASSVLVSGSEKTNRLFMLQGAALLVMVILSFFMGGAGA